VGILYAPEELAIEVADNGTAADDAPPEAGAEGTDSAGGVGLTGGTGHGLIGMRERAHSVGGAFTAGPLTRGGFRVRAVLPTAESEEGAA
jgi:signal transduction histidine kinase